MRWPKLERRKAALVAARDLRDAISELRLIAAMVALTLARCALEKFGGDSTGELKRNFDGYREQLKRF